MFHQFNKLIILSFILITIVAVSAAIIPTKKFKNLKVLPQDISEKKLDSIMGAYGSALNVSCDFCHSKAKKDMFSISAQPDSLDFAADNSMKENARRMIRMMIDLNRNYFYFDSTVRPEYLNVVSCNTCHRGNPYPANN